jgi:MafB19-like deaminase
MPDKDRPKAGETGKIPDVPVDGKFCGPALTDPFAELAAERVKRNLPPTTAQDNDLHTISKLVISGKPYFGVNRKNQNPKRKMTLVKVNPTTLQHAEADATQQAVDDGMAGSAKEAHLWIDRPPCESCGIKPHPPKGKGGLRSLARNLKVEKLRVYYLTPEGVESMLVEPT